MPTQKQRFMCDICYSEHRSFELAQECESLKMYGDHVQKGDTVKFSYETKDGIKELEGLVLVTVHQEAKAFGKRIHINGLVVAIDDPEYANTEFYLAPHLVSSECHEKDPKDIPWYCNSNMVYVTGFADHVTKIAEKMRDE